LDNYMAKTFNIYRIKEIWNGNKESFCWAMNFFDFSILSSSEQPSVKDLEFLCNFLT
jgi:hypothetical protein